MQRWCEVMMIVPDDKQVSEAIEDLADRAVECTHLAKTQRTGADAQQAIADTQHDEARKLETMGEALIKDVADLKRKVVTSPRKT